MSNVILEALASGLPVAASNIPGNDELIEDGTNGFLLDPEPNPRKPRMIRFLCSNQTEWKTLARPPGQPSKAVFPGTTPPTSTKSYLEQPQIDADSHTDCKSTANERELKPNFTTETQSSPSF